MSKARDIADLNVTILDSVEASATADQTNAEIRAAVEAATDSNVFTDADHSKLNGINQGVATTDSPTFVDVTATSLDISGDIDVDGVTNLDVVDIDGAVDMASTLTVSGDANFDSGTLFVDVSANAVGIGTTATTTGTSTYYDDLVIKNATSGTGAGITIQSNTSNGYGGLEFRKEDGTQVSKIFASSAGGDMGLETAGITRLNIASDGSLSTPTAGTSNVRFGVNAGNSIASGGNFNTVVGDEAGTGINTGTGNCALGNNALNDCSSGDYNVALGYQSQRLTTTANNCTGLGSYTLYDNTTGSENTAVGFSALGNNTTSSYSTAVGNEAGKAATGNGNTFIGNGSGYQVTTGTRNTFIGVGGTVDWVGGAITTGSKNTIIGGYNGNQNGLDIRTSSNNIVLSDGDGNPVLWGRTSGTHIYSSITSAATAFVSAINSTNASSQIIRGANSAANINDVGATVFVVFGNGNVQNTNNSYAGISDLKLKENIVDAPSQWNDIKAITVRKYSLKTENSDSPTQIGVIAQELESSGMSGLVDEHIDLGVNDEDLGTTTKGVKYSVLYMKAIKALQEAMERIESLETRITTLEG